MTTTLALAASVLAALEIAKAEEAGGRRAGDAFMDGLYLGLVLGDQSITFVRALLDTIDEGNETLFAETTNARDNAVAVEWAALVRGAAADESLRSCRVCGCTDARACPGGCSWVPDPEERGDLCSDCAADFSPEASEG